MMMDDLYPYTPREANGRIASLYNLPTWTKTLDAVTQAIAASSIIIWSVDIEHIINALELAGYDAAALDAVRAAFGLKGACRQDSPPIIEARIVSRREGEDDRLTPPAVTSMS